MKTTIFSRIFALFSVVAGFALTSGAQSFTIHMKNGTTQSYNNADVDSIAFSPDSYDPGQNQPFLFSEPANTYIVSRAGEYEFYPKRPGGSEISGIVRADWIWAQKLDTLDTAQKLISDVRYEEGKVKFKATGNRGNAVVGAFDGSGKIIWVWLVWMTEQPEDKDFEGGSKFMDRFMGATSAKESDGKKTWGAVVYQWGRPVPLFGGFEDEWDELGQTFDEARKWTIMNATYNLEWKVEKGYATLEDAIAAPTTFFAGKNGNWLEKQNPELWKEEKTDYDPSPAGYRLPAFADWGENFISIMTPKDDESGAIYTYNGSESFFPAGNQNRMYSTGENVLGYPGFMCWNTAYFFNDYMNLLENPDCPYKTPEELIENGLASFTPTRVNFQVKKDTAVKAVRAAANPAFAIPVRCVKIK